MPFVARIILVGRKSVKHVFHFVINQLKRYGIFMAALSGLSLFSAVRGDSLAVRREQVKVVIGCRGSRTSAAGGLLWAFFRHKKTGAWPVFIFLFAVGSEE